MDQASTSKLKNMMGDPSRSAFQKYRDVTYGNVGLGRVLWAELVCLLLASMPGAPGLWLRGKLYRSFFKFDGPPQTSHELNGWGDNVVHGYLRGVERRGRLGVIYANQDYGCEWDYDWRNKRFLREDNTKFAVNIVVYAMG